MSQIESSQIEYLSDWVESELSQRLNFRMWVALELSKIFDVWVKAESADSLFQDEYQEDFIEAYKMLVKIHKNKWIPTYV